MEITNHSIYTRIKNPEGVQLQSEGIHSFAESFTTERQNPEGVQFIEIMHPPIHSTPSGLWDSAGYTTKR